MSQLEKQIAQKIQEIADGTKGKRFTVMSGKVVMGSINETEGSCKVLLSKDAADTPTENIIINVVLENQNGFILYPADNSDVLVAEIDGPNKYGIIKCSTIVKAVIMFNATASADHCLTMEDALFKVRNGNFHVSVDGSNVVCKANHSTLTGTDNLFQFNNGSFGGIVKVTPLLGRLNTLETDLASLKTSLSAWTAAVNALSTAPLTGSSLGTTMTANIMPYTASSVGTTSLSAIENADVKHGPHA